MGVPVEVRKVERPEGTIVYAYGKNGDRYGVKRREFVEVDGKVVQRDGPTIGHIIDLKYVPIDERVRIRYDESDFLYWADAQLIVNLTRDILEDLLAVYHREDALRTYVMAILRTTDEGLTDDDMKDAYEQSYLKVMYPGVALSKNEVGQHLFDLGRTCSHITEFMKVRTSRVPENHNIAVDGMLKSNESEMNSFSAMSRKATTRGTRDISVMYAFDIEAMEPVCSRIYPGNMPDTSAFADFLQENGILKGVIIVDKGFKYSSAKQVFLDNPGLHFLIPLRRDSKVIDEYRLLAFDSALRNRDAVQCRKVRMQDGRFLYSFRDVQVAQAEERTWTNSHEDYDPGVLAELRREFGTIVFISDLDAPPETIYSAYEERWELEVMFRFYKSILDMDETRVHEDQSVIGTEFVNLLSVIMTCRLRKAFAGVERLRKKSFKKCRRLLRKGVMSRPDRDTAWAPRKLTEADEKVFIQLGIIEVPEQPPRKRGRRKKAPDAQ